MLHYDQTQTEYLNYLYTFINIHTQPLYKWPYNMLNTLSHSDIQIHTDTQAERHGHRHIESATEQSTYNHWTVWTHWVADCLFDSIPYNKLYDWVRRLFFLPRAVSHSTLRLYIVTLPSSLIIVGENRGIDNPCQIRTFNPEWAEEQRYNIVKSSTDMQQTSDGEH